MHSRTVGRLGLPSIPYTWEVSGHALDIGRLWGGRLAGTLAVLACVALPLALGELATWQEHMAASRYVEALGATGFASPSGTTPSYIPALQIDTAPKLLDGHYYFVNGCVSAPRDCLSVTTGEWGEYFTALRLLYEEAIQAAPCGEHQPFDEWAMEHTHFIISQTAPVGADKIRQALAQNDTGSDVHIVGTSAGGAAAFSYLSRAMRGEIPVDRRMRSVLTVDSPLGQQALPDMDDAVSGLLGGLQASSMRTDVQHGIGEWAAAANIAILTVDTREDVVGYTPVDDVLNDSHPVYQQEDTPRVPAYLSCDSIACRLLYFPEFLDTGSTWHVYTGSHMADSVREFIDLHWK